MTVWIDAQLSPDLATWFRETLAITAVAVRDLGLRDATDEAIFQAAREADVVVLTKDGDFVRLLERRGPPPRVVWLSDGPRSSVPGQEELRAGQGLSRPGVERGATVAFGGSSDAEALVIEPTVLLDVP